MASPHLGQHNRDRCDLMLVERDFFLIGINIFALAGVQRRDCGAQHKKKYDEAREHLTRAKISDRANYE